MSKLTYKILNDPSTFKSFVREITVPESGDTHPLIKRDMTNEEVERKWTYDEFIEELSKYGYNSAAVTHAENHNMYLHWRPMDDYCVRLSDETAEGRTDEQLEDMVNRMRAIANEYDFDVCMMGSWRGFKAVAFGETALERRREKENTSNDNER